MLAQVRSSNFEHCSTTSVRKGLHRSWMLLSELVQKMVSASAVLLLSELVPKLVSASAVLLLSELVPKLVSASAVPSMPGSNRHSSNLHHTQIHLDIS
jgi:hypothetical protein